MISLLLAVTMLAEPNSNSNSNSTNTQLVIITNQATYLALELAQAEVQLATDRANLSPDHPMRAFQQQKVESLKKALGQQGDPIEDRIVQAAIEKAIAHAEAELARGAVLYSNGHPKLALSRARLESLRDLLK